VGTGAKRHILAAECDDLADSQTGLDRDEEQGTVASTDPGSKVWGVEKSIDLLLAEELHYASLKALARDRKHPLAEERVRWIREGDIPEESVERREAGVAAASGVAAFALKVVEELAKEGGVEVGELEAGGSAAEPFGGETQEQAEGVSVGGHRVWACLPLREQAVGKESLEQRWEIGEAHRASSRVWVARSVASRSSSGTASMYQ
jgi:hypothetical protein